jgi:glycine/D-amino acid oxidase-like deaminating enzyme
MRVLVIGSGVIGLSTAILLLQQNKTYSVTIVTDKSRNATTSFISGASWTPEVNVGPLEKTIIWAHKTYEYFKKLCIFSPTDVHGVSICSGYRFGYEPVAYDSDPLLPKDFEIYNFNKVCKIELIRLENDNDNVLKNTKYNYAWKYEAPCIDMGRYLEFLENEFFRLGGNGIILRKLNSLEEVIRTNEFDIIVNCSGLGAKTLVNDNDMVPIRGQTLIVKFDRNNEGLHKKNYFFKAKDTNESVTYIYPRGNGVYVLGGTFEMDKEDQTIDEKIANDIIRRCDEMVPQLRIHDQTQCLGHFVGLRPYRRRGVRLELEQINDVIIVHNYGHCGSGVTLSYGSALEVIQLLQNKSIV